MNASNSSPADSWSDLTTPTMKWVFRVVFSLSLMLGVFGNGTVCVAIALKQRLRTANNLLVFNLAASDFIFVALYAHTQLSLFENHFSWKMGDSVCMLVNAVLPSCLSSTIGTLLCISLIRYKAVASPFRVRMTLVRTAILIAAIWFLSLLSALPVFLVSETRNFGDKVFCYEGWPEGKRLDEAYWAVIFAVQYAIPLVSIVILSIATVVAFKRSRARVFPPSSAPMSLNESASVCPPSLRQRQRQENSMSKLLACLVVLYGVCLLPQHIVYFWNAYGNLKAQKYSLYIYTFANVFPIANSALNPVIYGSFHKELRLRLKNCVKCR